MDIDRLGEKLIRSLGGIPNFLHYNGYPASICVSVNDEVVHGIPSKHRILQEGDIVSLDAGLIYKGFHSDAARTHAVGKVSPEAQKLMDVTKQSFFEGIKYAKAGHHLNEIGAAIGDYAESFGYGVVEELCGHGIGRNLHEDPEIPNFRQKRRMDICLRRKSRSKHLRQKENSCIMTVLSRLLNFDSRPCRIQTG